ncbi:signal recognition particle protein [Beijerinckia indica]|uniref:Signal recognition particle protein n=1 Tax=Beijerinckia indica subsp. indica (strain ATCC 9039 / DSM 1715 / NCIMB 8712) TaxID=395963 RepID=B2IDX6_BEII9|nr:signal recognition particle protein [Beijerinckia indica]ACB96908.1 signal recognition particle protein [Beijerinckia indica subsp. indica ATCC 9039]
MFEGLSERLSGIFDALTQRGALNEEDVDIALREVRRALLEADVSLDVVRSFVDKVRNRALGSNVVRSVTPGQMVVKIVNDVMIETLGKTVEPIDLDAAPPVGIMMVGLQGAGKTTTTAKIAKRLTDRFKRKVLMASLDVKRPAAQEQLAVLGKQINVATLPIIAGQTPVQIAQRAEQAARLQGFDVVLLDTAGRTHIDEALMAEMAEIKAASSPHEILLVVDSLTGQDAVNLAKNFDDRVGITGIVLTRIDGDGRGGAALSMRAVTGKPIKLIGTGEKIDALEDFYPDRIANRILGMGDIVSLVEKAAQTIDAEKAEKMAAKLRKGKFDLEDLSDQLAQAEKLGGISGIMGMLPGMGKLKDQLASANIDDKVIKRQRSIILSMTPQERRNPDLIKASRKKRIAAGSGMKVEDVNKLLKQHRQMADLMKAFGGGKMGKMGKMASMLGGKGLGGGLGALGGGLGGLGGGMPSAEDLAALQKQFGQLPQPGANPGPAPGLPPAPPAGLPKLPADPSSLFGAPPTQPGGKSGGLPGLGGMKLPGLGGFNPFAKKK